MSPSTSVIAMSVRGVTSPSMLNAVRPSRTATLNEVQPTYPSFPMRLARLSPPRCQNSTPPSAPALSIMSSMRDASATSSKDFGLRTSDERREDLSQVDAPFHVCAVRDRVAPQFPQPLDDERNEAVPVALGHVRRRGADLVEAHCEDLLELTRADEGRELAAEERLDRLVLPELLRLLELLDEQDPGELLEFRRDGLVVGREDLRRDGLRFE